MFASGNSSVSLEDSVRLLISGPKGQPFSQRRATPWEDDPQNIVLCFVM
jgi:hypothetical protein